MRSHSVRYSLSGISVFISILLLLWTKNVDGIQIWDMPERAQIGRAPLWERFTWKTMDFAYPDERSRMLAIASGEYIAENSLPVGIEIWRNKLFVTVPRWRDGECQRCICHWKNYAYTFAPGLIERYALSRRRDRQHAGPPLMPETRRDASKVRNRKQTPA